VLGSFCAGFVLIPLLGKENSLSLVIGAQLLTSLVIAGIILGRRKQNLLKLAFLAAPALAGLILCLYFPIWNRQMLSKGKYHRFNEIGLELGAYGWLEALLRGPEIFASRQRPEVVYYGDGIGGFTTVLKHLDPFGKIEYTMLNSGKADASSRGDMNTQTLLAHFPMLLHPNPKTVMVLGLASGVTAGEALYYPIEQLDVLEISQQVVEASDFFRPWNNDVLSNTRTNLIGQDARAHLQLTKQKYDIIISEPSNPWMAGLASLFTRDFFDLVENRLNEGGIFCQWVHSYQMDWQTFALIGRTLAQVFPTSLIASTQPSTIGNDYLLVGFKRKNKLILENAERNLSYVRQSENITLSDPRILYRLVLSEDLRTLFGAGPANTDNWPVLEFTAPRLMHHVDAVIGKNILSEKRLMPETINIIRQLGEDVEARIDFAVFAFSVHGPFPKMIDLTNASPSQEKRFFELLDTYCANNPVDYSILKDEQLEQRCRAVQIKAIQARIDSVPDKAASYFYLANLYDDQDMLDEAIACYSKSLQIRPDNAEAHYNLGYNLTSMGRLDEAITHFTETLRIKPGFAMAHTELGYALASQGRLDEATTQYTESLRIKPDNAKAHSNLGGVLTRQKKFEQAIEHFTEALRIDPNFADALNNLGYALARQGKLDEAIKYYTKALQVKPDFADTHYNFGVALARQRKFDEAIMHFNEALRIRPGFKAARESLQKALYFKKKTQRR
jgi:spermidine synthase